MSSSSASPSASSTTSLVDPLDSLYGSTNARRGSTGANNDVQADPSQGHSLTFRVMRLARADFKASPTLRCEVRRNGETALPAPAASDQDWSAQVQLSHPTDACGLDGSLVLPQNFGNIQLGETFSCYISLGNASSRAVSNISIRVELQTERQRRNIFENTSKPLPTLGPNQRYDFIITHDVKELGTHTLVCSTVYTEGQSDRKYLPQWYKFNVTNPLIVKMKVRAVQGGHNLVGSERRRAPAERTFVEACLENATGEPLFLELVRFDANPGLKLLQLPGPAAPERTLFEASDVGAYLESLVLLKGKGEAYNFVFGLERTPALPSVPGGSPGGGAEGASPGQLGGGLGKLEIKWRKPMGDSGRLQTQQIAGQAKGKAERLEASVVEAPGRVQVHVPFAAKIAVRNLDPVKTLTSLFVVLSTYLDSSVRCVGQSGRFLPQIPAGESVDVAFDLIALKPGIQKIGPLVFFDDKGKVEYGKPARAHGGRTEPNAPRALFYPAHTGCKRVKMC